MDLKRTARARVAAEVRAGRMTRPAFCLCKGCPMCMPRGSCNRKKPQAHHPNHLNPLIVDWLCVECHRYADNVTKFTPDVVAKAKRLRNSGMSYKMISERVGISIRKLREVLT